MKKKFRSKLKKKWVRLLVITMVRRSLLRIAMTNKLLGVRMMR